MNLNPFSPVIKKSLESVFISDNHGNTIFFPWGARRKGYILNDQDLQKKFSKFYSVSFTIYFIVLILLIALFHNSAPTIVVIFAWSACFLIVYRLYTNRITESLPLANSSFADIFLDKIGPNEDETEDRSQPLLTHPVPINYPAPQPVKVSLLRRLRLFLYPLPSGLWSAILWLIGAAIAVIWHTFHPAQYSGDRVEGLTAFFVTFFIGLGLLVYGIKGDPLPGRSSNPWPVVILILGFSLFFLYTFIVGK